MIRSSFWIAAYRGVNIVLLQEIFVLLHWIDKGILTAFLLLFLKKCKSNFRNKYFNTDKHQKSRVEFYFVISCPMHLL